MGKVETDAHALCLPGTGSAVKPSKNFGLFLLGNARAGIRYPDGREQFIVFYLYRHSSAGRAVLHSVVQQISHRLLRPLGIEYGGTFLLPNGQGNALFRCPGDILRGSHSTTGEISPG